MRTAAALAALAASAAAAQQPPRSIFRSGIDLVTVDVRTAAGRSHAAPRAIAPIRGLKTIFLVSEGMLRDRDVTEDLRRSAEPAAAARGTADRALRQSADRLTAASAGQRHGPRAEEPARAGRRTRHP